MSKKYFVEGKGYITISPEEEPIFLSEYRNAVEVKPKETEVKASVPAMSALPKKIDLLKTSSDVESLLQPLGNGKTTQFNARLKAEQDAELEVAKTNVRRREAVEAQYGNLARDFGDNSPQAQKQLAELRKYDDMVDPQNIKTPIARDYLMQYHKDRNTQIWSTRLQNLAKTQAELASQKDASPDWNKRYNAINKEIAHANELYRYYASGMTDAEAGLVRAGEQISNSFGNTWTGIVPRAFISFGSGAVDMLYSPMALGGVLAGGQGGLANQRFVSQGLSTETGNILSDLLQQTAYSAPMTIATMANPALGAALTFSNIIEANMNDVAVKYGSWDKAPKGTQTAAITSGIISGAIEYGSNLIQIGVVRKLSAARTPASFSSAKSFIKSTITGKGRALGFAKAMGIDGVVEGTEEYVDSMSSDLLNNALGETNYTMAEMVAHANKAFIGGAFGGLTFGLFGGGYHSLQARSQWKTTEALAKANNPTAKTVMQMVAELKKDSPDVQVVNAKAEQLMQAKSEGIKNKKLEMAVANILDSVYANGLYASSYEEMQRQFPDNEQINSFDVVMLKQGIYEVYQELNKLTSGKPNQKNQTKERIATTLKAIAQEISFGHNDRALQLLSQMQVQNLGNIQADPEMSGFYQSASKIIGKLTRYATQGKQASDAYASLRGNQIEQNRIVDINPAPEIAPQKAETQPWEQPKQEAPLETSVIFAEAYKVDKNLKAKPEQIAETLTRIDQVMQSDAPDTMKKVLGEIRDRLTARLAEPTETKEEKPTKETKEVKPVKPVEPVTAGQTKVIHIKKKQLELSDEAYRAEVKAVSKGRTETSKELAYAEAQALMNRLNKMEKPKKVEPKKEVKPKPKPKPKAKVEKPKKAEPKPTKKVWEMTKAEMLEVATRQYLEKNPEEIKSVEYREVINKKTGKMEKVPSKYVKGKTKVTEELIKSMEAMHKQAIQKAMNDGEKIPEEVLKDYPELSAPVQTEEDGPVETKTGEDKIKELLTEINDKSKNPSDKYGEELYPERRLLGSMLMPNLRASDYDELAKNYLMLLDKEITQEQYDEYVLDRIASNAVSGISEEEQKQAQEKIDKIRKERYSKESNANVPSSKQKPNISLGDLISHYKASGFSRQEAWKQYVTDTILSKIIETQKVDTDVFFDYFDNLKYPSLSEKYPLVQTEEQKPDVVVERTDGKAYSDEVDAINAEIDANTKTETDKIKDEMKVVEANYGKAISGLNRNTTKYKDLTGKRDSEIRGLSRRIMENELKEADKVIEKRLPSRIKAVLAEIKDRLIKATGKKDVGFTYRTNTNSKALLVLPYIEDDSLADGAYVPLGYNIDEAVKILEQYRDGHIEELSKEIEQDKAETVQEIPSIEIYSPSARMNGRGKLRAEKIARLYKLETLQSEGVKKVKVGSAVMSIETAIRKTEASLDDKTLSEYRKPKPEPPTETKPASEDEIIIERHRITEALVKKAFDEVESAEKAMGISFPDVDGIKNIIKSTLSTQNDEDIRDADKIASVVDKKVYEFVKDMILSTLSHPEARTTARKDEMINRVPILKKYGLAVTYFNSGDNASATEARRVDAVESSLPRGSVVETSNYGLRDVDRGVAIYKADVKISRSNNVVENKGLTEPRILEAEAVKIAKPEQTPITDRKSFQKRYREAQPSLSTEQIDAQLQAYDALFETYSKAMGISLDDAYKTFQISNLDPKENSLSQAERADIAEAERQMEAVRKQYQGTDQWMKAPNGKPTKLNERQWLQVRTPNFLNWFGNWINDPANASKVVDENGEPKVMYHSTQSKFTEFKPSWRGLLFFAETPDDALAGYGAINTFGKDTDRMQDNRLYSVFLSAKNIAGDKGKSGRIHFQTAENDRFREKLIADKYDSAYIRDEADTTIAVFSPTQIKSATANVGTFDPENADIRYQKVLGYLTTKPDGNMIIGFLNPDFSTGLHEQAHIGEVFLKSMAKTDPKWKQVLGWAEDWLGVEKGKWTVEQSEKFAQGYEKYLLEGKAPNSKMQAVFNQIKAWMNAIANKVKELAGIELTDQMRQVYSVLLGGEIVKPTLTKAQKAQAVEVKENLKLKESTSVNEFAHEMEVLIGKFNNLTLSQPRAGKFSILNVDLGKVILEITSKDGFEINGTAYTNVYDALVAVTDLLGENTASNSVTRLQVAETTNDKEEMEKLAKRKANSEKIIRSQYQKVAEAIENYGIKTEKGQPIGLPAWRNALISAVDTILHEQIGVSKLTADKLKRISEQTVKPETVKRWLEDERRYREVMQMYSGYDNSSKIPTIQLFTMMAQLSPHYYKSMTANTTIENFINLYNNVKDEIEGDPEQFLEGLLYLTMTQGNVASSPMGEFTTWLAQPVKVLVSLFGTAGKRLYGYVQEGTITRARIQEKAAPSQKIILRTLATSENDANRKYTPAERKEIGRILVSIASNEDLTAKEKPEAMLAFVDSYNLKNSENPISEKDVLEIYYSVLDIVNMVQGEIEKLNSDMGEWVIGIRESYFPRTLISINKMFDSPLNEEEVQIGKPAYAEERELKQPDMSKLSVDLLKDIDHYVSSMSRYIAFYPVKEYYTKRFKQEIPANVKVHEGKSAMDYARDYVNTAMGKYKVRGKLEDVISITRTNVYAATLATSSALTVQNMAQKLLIMTVVPPKVYRAVMRDTNVATGKPINRKEMPMLSLLLDVLNNANPNQMHEYRRELQDISKDDDSALIRFYAKWSKNISENALQYSPFGLAEKGNWGYGYVAGVYVVCMKSKPYQEARADKKTHREAVEIALSNPKVMQAAMMAAGYVNAKVNADPSLVFSPQVYGTFAGRQMYYIKYFHNFMIIAKEIIFYQGIASKWSRELFDQTLYSTNGEDAVSDRIRSLNMMIKDLDPKRLAKMERETHDLREANLPLSDMVKMHGALIELRDELVTGMRKQERLLKSGRLIQADAAAGLLGFMLADYLIIMIIRYLKSRRHKYFAEKHVLGDRKTARVMRQKDFDPAEDALRESQIPRLLGGIGVWQGVALEVDFNQGWKGVKKQGANWTAKTLPLVNILNNLSLEIFGDTGTNIMIDKISEQ